MRSPSLAAVSGLGTAHRSGSAEAPPGDDNSDPYRWLEDPESAPTRSWLARRITEFTAHAATWPARDRLAAEIRALVASDDWSAPRRRGDTVFATHRVAGADHPRLVAFPAGGAPREPRVLFDPLAADPDGRTTLDAWEVDPTGRFVAVQTSRDGTERGALRVLDTATGEPVSTPITGVRYTHVAWVPDAKPPAFYYVRRDDGDGRRGVWLRRVDPDGPAVADVLVRPCGFGGTVPGVRIAARRWLIVSEGHGTGHREDLWVADLASDPPERPVLREVHAGDDIESEPRVGPDGLLYLRTTAGAPLRRLCRLDPAAPGTAAWQEVVAADGAATLDAFALVGAEIVAGWTRLGISELTVHDRADGCLLRRVALPGEGMVTSLTSVPDPWGGTSGDDVVCVGYADVATPQRVLLYRAGGDRLTAWPGPDVAEGGAPAVYRRVTSCRSPDGAEVPVTVFSTRPFDGPRPTIVHAYGAYGRPRQFGFSATVLAWLRLGGQYAVAHVRGGGDLGRAWHVAGTRRDKPNSVVDLCAAVDALVTAGYCDRAQVCLSGGSAGGLLVLAAVARRPDLCAAVIASAPLADMVRFESLGMGAMWTREFGSAADPADLTVLRSYSPYHRVLARGRHDGYPAVLLTGFHGDTRTDAAHPRKMCAALRWATGADEHAGRATAHSGAEEPSRVLLRYEYGVGHGPRAVSRAVALAADAHAFAAALTGLAPAVGVKTSTVEGGETRMDPKEKAVEIEVEVEDLAEVTSRDITAGGDSDGKDGSSDFI